MDWTILEDTEPEASQAEQESSEQQSRRIRKEYEEIFPVGEINGIEFIPCAAHTLQLAVKDFVKQKDIASTIAVARELARKLRIPKVRYHFMKKGHHLPRLDNETRWSSTYLLIQSLIRLKEVIQELEQKGKVKGVRGGSKRFWDKLESIYEALDPAFQATNYFQREQLTAGLYLQNFETF